MNTSTPTQSAHRSSEQNGEQPKPALSKRPSFARLVTSTPNVPLTITPATAISAGSSRRNSPTSTPSAMGATHTSLSLQNTPEGLAPQQYPTSAPPPTGLSLPDSIFTASPPTSSPFAMSEAMSNGRGLIRRISRTTGRFRSRRGSQAASQRDQSCGPTILRRRSDSRNTMDYPDVSDLDLEPDDEVLDDLEPPLLPAFTGLGISTTSAPNRPSISSEVSAVAPIRLSILSQGMNLQKVTRKKVKTMKFRLDQDSAKVTWEAGRSQKQFYIDDIKELRLQKEARMYREECSMSSTVEPYWFTIVYVDPDRSKGRSLKTMHLVAPDQFTFDLWTQNLDRVSRDRINLMAGLAGPAEKSAKILWKAQMDKKFQGVEHAEDEEKLDFEAVIKLCRNLEINASTNVLHAHFDMVDPEKTGNLTLQQFLAFVRRLKERKDIRYIFNQAKPADQTEMDRDTFFKFLQYHQKSNVEANRDHWDSVFERFSAKAKTRQHTTPKSSDSQLSIEPTMGFWGFQSYLSSNIYNGLMEPASMEGNFNRPLNEYIISSSHNTYLLGRQVAGVSSAEAYISALQKGCRCVEVDCWDGSDGKPIVNHGRTMTAPCSFADCIRVIAKYAFISSPYPLVISLEVHCNDAQQTVMTEIMKREFGEMMITKPLDEFTAHLPSPEDLKFKILIKVKAPKDSEDKALLPFPEPTRGRRQRSISSPWPRPAAAEHPIQPNSPALMSTPSLSPPSRSASFWDSPRASATSQATPYTMMTTSADDSDSPPPSVTSGRASEKGKPNKKTSNIVRVLGELGVYTQGRKFSGFNSPESKTFNHVFSLAERAFHSACKADSLSKAQLEAHNTHYLMRVYPAGWRIKSDNFDPLTFWRRGVQMAALNWQTYDLGMQMNDAMFAAGTDKTGYILKPEELRQNMDVGHDDHLLPLLRKQPKRRVKFAVEIISVQQLPRPKNLSIDANMNPYVEFEMFCAEDKSPGIATGEGGHDASARNGMSGIGSPLRKRTKIVEGNGYDPTWGETLSLTLETKYPSLVFVRLRVWNSPDGRSLSSSNVPLATFTGKLSSLREGYRHIPLCDANGEQYLCSTLFCGIRKQGYEAIEEKPPSSAVSDGPSPTADTRGIFRRVFSRTNSDRKKKIPEPRQAGNDTDSAYFSRTSTIEK